MKVPGRVDDLWLRVWANRHAGTSVPTPPAVPELAWEPWPRATSVTRVLPPVPSGFAGDWTPSSGGSNHLATFLGDHGVLRVAVTSSGQVGLQREAAVLRLGVVPTPRLLDEGDYWLLLERLDGVRPSGPGPWVAEMVDFARRFHRLCDARADRVLSLRPPVDLTPLAAVAGSGVVEVLNDRSCWEAPLVPTHGDLNAGNLLVDGGGHLCGVIDFETAALAPPERDVVAWVTLLSTQVGLASVQEAVRLLCPTGVDGGAVHAELLRQLAGAARSALAREDPAPYAATVRFLAEHLAADPDLPFRLLGG